MFSPEQRDLWYANSPWFREVIEQCLTCVAKDRPSAMALQDRSGYVSYKRGWDVIQQQSSLIQQLDKAICNEESLRLKVDEMKAEVTAAFADRD